jgi:hypothetical protein
MHIHARLLAVPFALAALAVPGRASVPGNIPDLSYAGLLHVCEDNEPDDGPTDYIPCDEHEADDPTQPYTGSECVTAGLPAVCVTDFVPKVRLKGTLTLAFDDAALDGSSTPHIQGETVLILELKKGAKKRTFIELYDGSKIGNWNPLGVETFLTGVGGIDFETNGEFQFANQNLTDLGLEIRDQAALWFPNADLSTALPVITSIARNTKKDPIDEDEFEQKLASAAFFKVTLEFARALP